MANMSADPKLRLVVRYPDGREASYPLQVFDYDIGSGEFCSIRIEHPYVEPRHASLYVKEDGVWIENHRRPRTLLVCDAPLRGRARFKVRDSVRLFDIEIELLP